MIQHVTTAFILTYKEDRDVDVPVLKDRAVKYRHTELVLPVMNRQCPETTAVSGTKP
jgi:hypothetical protein